MPATLEYTHIYDHIYIVSFKKYGKKNIQSHIDFMNTVGKITAETVKDKNAERADKKRRPLTDEQHERRIKIPLISGTGSGTNDPQP